MVDLEIGALAVMGKYTVNDNFSVLGGLKEHVADAIADIFKLSGATTAATVTGGSETEHRGNMKQRYSTSHRVRNGTGCNI